MSNVSSLCKRYWRWLAALYVASSLLWGPAAEAAFRLDYAPSVQPTHGLFFMPEIVGVRTQPQDSLPASYGLSGASKPAQVHIRPPADPWACIARYESGSDPTEHSGYYEGMYQFAPSTWRDAGGTQYASHAYQATPEEQTIVAQGWLEKTSWAQWPQTSRRCGLR